MYIIAENLEKALIVWRNIQSWINAGESLNTLPTRTEVAALYKIKYTTFQITSVIDNFLLAPRRGGDLLGVISLGFSTSRCKKHTKINS